jgi:uncharacterized membrane protein
MTHADVFLAYSDWVLVLSLFFSAFPRSSSFTQAHPLTRFISEKKKKKKKKNKKKKKRNYFRLLFSSTTTTLILFIYRGT